MQKKHLPAKPVHTLMLISEIVNDQFTPGVRSLGLKEHGLALGPFDQTIVTDDMLGRLETLKQEIIEGKIVVTPWEENRPMRPFRWLRRWWQARISHRLLIHLGVSTLVLVICFGVVAALIVRADALRDVGLIGRQLAEQAGQEISTSYNNMVDAVVLLGRQMTGPDVSLRQQARAMLEFRRADPGLCRALYLFDANGSLLVHLADRLDDLMAIAGPDQIIERPSVPVPEEVEAARRATAQDEPFISPAQIVGMDQVPVLYIAVPLTDPGGDAGHVLVTEIDLRPFWLKIDKIHVGRTDRALIAAQDGTIIAHSDRSRIGQPLAAALEPVLQGYQGQVRYVDPISGKAMLATFGPVSRQSGWGIVVEREEAEALGPVRNMAMATMMLSLAAIAAATVNAFLIGASIARPIQRLATATHYIAKSGRLDQPIEVIGHDEIGQLATSFNQMIATLRQSETRTTRLLAQQTAINRLALALGEYHDLDSIYRVTYDHVSALMDADAFIIAFFDREDELIHAGFVMTRGVVRDLRKFPPIPLEKEGHGTQSRVIRSGEPLYAPNFREFMKTTEREYSIAEDGEVIEGPPPEEEMDDSTNSALFVPMKVQGEVMGVMQVQSDRLDAYTQDDLQLLAGVANVTAVAIRNAQLYQQAQQELAERRRAEAALQAYSQQLEAMVAARTADLVAANRELESFAYSVSHDLRAPLRGIDGWSLALLEDYGDQLDEEAHTYLARVRSEAQRMGRLIDDLLRLSRVSRGEMQRVPVDLSAVAAAIADRLKQGQPERQAEFIIQPGLIASGDPRLLEIALTNLMDNAWKFTGPRAVARIEFGRTEVDGKQAFFVRDNGVGFDMAYAGKLFGAFQRLHKATQFPGSGIGLATVQRIIHRHGGRVWAQGEVDEGATITFTLKEEA